jgi:hypothetical protein
MWKIQGKELQPLSSTKIPLEEKLEDLVAKHPEILGENLLIIGRQVQVEEVKDRLDLLAIDEDLNVVVIELKKGLVKGGADIQSIKYASYVSNWGFDQLKEVAEAHFKENKMDVTFVNALQDFFGEDIDYEDINKRQKIILVGEDFDEKILSIGKWLLDQGVLIKFVKVQVLTDGENTFLKPETILAPTSVLQPVVERGREKGRPWLENGEDWHLNQRCNKQTAEKLKEIANYLTSLEGVEVSWNQEFYVALTINRRNWITIRTFPNQLNLHIHVYEKGRFKKDDIAKMLGIDRDFIEISEHSARDTIIIKIGPDFNVKSEQFKTLIEQTKELFIKAAR